MLLLNDHVVLSLTDCCPDVLGGGGSPAPHNQNMKFGGLPYEMHRLGGRNEVIIIIQ